MHGRCAAPLLVPHHCTPLLLPSLHQVSTALSDGDSSGCGDEALTEAPYTCAAHQWKWVIVRSEASRSILVEAFDAGTLRAQPCTAESLSCPLTPLFSLYGESRVKYTGRGVQMALPPMARHAQPHGYPAWRHDRLRGGRARSRCRFVPLLIHFIPDLFKYLVPLCLNRQCDRTLRGGGPPVRARVQRPERLRGGGVSRSWKTSTSPFFTYIILPTPPGHLPV